MIKELSIMTLTFVMIFYITMFYDLCNSLRVNYIKKHHIYEKIRPLNHLAGDECYKLYKLIVCHAYDNLENAKYLKKESKNREKCSNPKNEGYILQ